MNEVDRTFWRNKRVLVTGHTGFKGSWLSLWLTEMGAEVTGMALEPEGRNNLFKRLRLDQYMKNSLIVDIRDIYDVRRVVQQTRPEIVFHLAAQPLVRESYKDPLGTWSTNVQGSLNILEALKTLDRFCSVVMVTTDKVYMNREWEYGYRECDRLGGHDPYSASKAAAELAIDSWRSSYCTGDGAKNSDMGIATARAGNVIGGGDWAKDRIVPDAIKSLSVGKSIKIRNPNATRPWQHVLEPLNGYLKLAEMIWKHKDDWNKRLQYCSAFNFGPSIESNRTVAELTQEILKIWPGSVENIIETNSLHEASKLHLHIDKSMHLLNWHPLWSFEETVKRTISWYKEVNDGQDEISCCKNDIYRFEKYQRGE